MPSVGVVVVPGGLSDLRTWFRAGKAGLISHFREGRPTAPAASRLTRALTRHVDATLAALWQNCGMPAGAALVAAGGYGRGELFPYSDVDVLVLLPHALDEDLRSTVADFVTACWDVGLEIGSSVRTVDECLAESARDVTVQTSLLEARLVCGAKRLFTQLRKAHEEAMDASAFLRAKTLELRQRHVKYEGTPYALEPNCKESPGGLRDLQVVIWVARAAGLGRTWAELAAKGLITPFEVSQLVRHEGALKVIRARLHMVAGRREDRLVFDLQTAVADSFGYKAAPARGQRSSEVLMHRYYWAAKAVTQLNQILMLNIEERINGSETAPMRPITPSFFDRAGMLEVAHDTLYLNNPHAILETFLVFQQTPGLQGLSARTLRALYNAREVMDAGFRRDPVNRALFMAGAAPERRHHPRHAADEPDQRAGALPVGVQAHRGAHAARPVPRLHGGPAHPDGGAQCAAFFHPRACARVLVLQPARVAVGQALGAVRRRHLSRRGQGPGR
jgi:[protein-PII] uridylyltransferase